MDWKFRMVNDEKNNELTKKIVLLIVQNVIHLTMPFSSKCRLCLYALKRRGKTYICLKNKDCNVHVYYKRKIA